MMTSKKKKKRIWTYLKHISIFISREKTGEKTSDLVEELSKIEKKDKIMENSYAMFQNKVVLNF